MKTFILFPLIFITSFVSAQKLAGDEWIDYNKDYYKIQIIENGVYRVTGTNLELLGVDLADIRPSNVQFYFRGKAMSVLVEDKDKNNFFDATDYIDFLGFKNDGISDNRLFDGETNINPYYNLFSDTSAVFFTNTNSPLRINKSSMQDFGVNANIRNTIQSIQNSTYANGINFSVDEEVYFPSWQNGKGWCSGNYPTNVNFDQKFILSNAQTVNQDIKIEIGLVGKGNLAHVVKISYSVDNKNFTDLETKTFYGEQFLNAQLTIPSVELNKNKELYIRCVETFFNQSNNFTTAFAVSYTTINYVSESIGTPNQLYWNYLSKQASGTVSVNSHNLSTNYWEYSDLGSIRMLEKLNETSTSCKIVLPPVFDLDGKLVGYTTPKPIINLRKANFKKIIPRKNLFLIVSHPLLTSPSTNYENPVRAYADYRASINGGQYATEVLMIQDLYDQYSYGETTPMAIRGMLIGLSKDSKLKPAFLFILGQSLLFNDKSLRNNHDSNLIKNLVPTYFTPGSDWGFSCDISPSISKYVPQIPVGRFSTMSPNDVENYLNKIKEYELEKPGQDWHKNIVMLSGGNTEREVVLLKNTTSNWLNYLKNNYIGGSIIQYNKTISAAIQSFDLSKEINDGTRFLCYIGHSESTNTDVNIGYVTDPRFSYNNKAKYPVLFLNGCNTGNVFDKSNNSSSAIISNWLKTPNKGAIATFGNSTKAFTYSIDYVTSEFLKVLGKDSVYTNKSIGELYCRAALNTNQTESVNPNVGTMLLTTLEGDPSLVIFPATKPDYSIVGDEIFVQSFDSKPVTAVSDSFQLAIIIKNSGKAIDSTTIDLQVKRITSNGTSILLDPMYINSTIRKDTIFYTVRTKDIKSFGDNYFEITVDNNQMVSELNENNNSYTFRLFLTRSSVECIFPRKYSIVNLPKQTLIAQSTDLLTDKTDFYFELDTTQYFNSKVLQSKIISGTKLPEWESVDLFSKFSEQDSIVFYWRARYLNPGKDTLVGSSSFTYIKNAKTGWAQAHNQQLNENTFYKGIEMDTLRRKLQYKKIFHSISITTAGSEVDNSSSKLKITINNSTILRDGRHAPQYGAHNGMVGIAFKRKNLDMYRIFEWPYHTWSTPYVANNFPIGDARWKDTLSKGYAGSAPYVFFKRYFDSIPNGDYVLLMSTVDANFPNWGDGLKSRVRAFGATKLEYLTKGTPYMFLGQKGGEALFEVTPDSSKFTSPSKQIIEIDNFILSQNQNTGWIETNKIGPAENWDTFYRKVNIDSKFDSYSVAIYGLNSKGESVLLKNNIKENDYKLTDINAVLYPFIKLRITLEDTVLLSPPQLKNWIVTYSNKTPEGTLLVDNARYTKTITLQEGAEHNFEYTFKNISQNDFKAPLYIQYSLKSTETGKQTFEYDTITSILKSGASFSKTYTFKSVKRVGNTILQIYVNPQLQQEEYFYNNVVSTSIKVEPDKSNPLLDVTFDGIRIMNGEIVSPVPSIEINMNDENAFLPKQDTVGMRVWLRRECDNCKFEPIDLASKNVNYFPASRTNKNFKIEYKPSRLEDGTYTLKVQGEDASKNKAGRKEFEVQFRVINQSSVTRVFPYPNPFTDYTRFVFTLTGDKIPDEMKIQIMTITGRIVREINQDEIGPLRIGNNISTYAWDGRDEFGDKLANGVYLYKVEMKNSGQSIQLRSSVSGENKNSNDADKAFKNEIGKLVIIR